MHKKQCSVAIIDEWFERDFIFLSVHQNYYFPPRFVKVHEYLTTNGEIIQTLRVARLFNMWVLRAITYPLPLVFRLQKMRDEMGRFCLVAKCLFQCVKICCRIQAKLSWHRLSSLAVFYSHWFLSTSNGLKKLHIKHLNVTLNMFNCQSNGQENALASKDPLQKMVQRTNLQHLVA